MDYAHDTCLRQRMPWGLFVGGRAMCPDGRVRALARISATADTFFSVPAAVKVRGLTVSGYVTCSEATDGQCFVEFRPYDYGRNADRAFPRRPFIAMGDLEWVARYRDTFPRRDGQPYWTESKDERL